MLYMVLFISQNMYIFGHKRDKRTRLQIEYIDMGTQCTLIRLSKGVVRFEKFTNTIYQII